MDETALVQDNLNLLILRILKILSLDVAYMLLFSSPVGKQTRRPIALTTATAAELVKGFG